MTTEILFYYESRQNPNGDPGFENQPRLMPDETIMVTDVRIKRTMRDYARDERGQTLFVDYDKNGNAITADGKASEIAGSLKKGKKIMEELLEKTFDVPLFGALVTIRKNESDSEGDSEKLTGPLQFGMSRSVNKVQIINPTIVGRFVGKEKKGKQFSTFGKFYSVEYALIKVQGAINPQNILQKYANNKTIVSKFEEKASMVFDCLWNGTNKLITRSKYPQRSILYIDVKYKDKIYNDLPHLINEDEKMRGMANGLTARPFDFSKFVEVMAKRKREVVMIRIKGVEEIEEDVETLVAELSKKGLNTTIISN